MSSPSWRRVIVLDAATNSIEVVQQELATFWVDFPWIGGIDRMSFELALIELVTNSIRYAVEFGESAQLEFAVSREELQAHLTDEGSEFHGDLDATTMPDATALSGRGLAVVKQLVDSLTYERRDGTNRWSIRRSLSTGGEPGAPSI